MILIIGQLYDNFLISKSKFYVSSKSIICDHIFTNPEHFE